MATDLSQGRITRHLFSFTIPLILGNLFQLTYNAVDSIIIGRFAGDHALAAVGTADPVMNLLILGITGLCIGSSSLMSSFYGRQMREKQPSPALPQKIKILFTNRAKGGKIKVSWEAYPAKTIRHLEMGTSLVVVGGASLVILLVGLFFSGAILRTQAKAEAPSAMTVASAAPKTPQ